ncbi:MAG: hypothetical protein K8F91_08495 [Candidatus Obscuribacterales bacterium]|nr:hypothetical protein [Candidatus Obscuribacterales bacterium]
MEEELIGVTVEHKDYWEWEGFEGLNLEDSIVREIRISRQISFVLDLVLNEQHPSFKKAKKNASPYMAGRITFEDVTEYTWTGQHVRPALRTSKDPDLGTIDALYFETGWYYIFGEWGELRFRAAEKSLVLDKK